MSASPIGPDAGEHTTHPSGRIDELGLKAIVAQVLDRWPCAGLAVAVIADGRLAWFHGHGLADVAAKTPITEDTVFRIASLTKTFTAVAVMQLWEQGWWTSTRRQTTTSAPFGWSQRSRTCRPPQCGTSSRIPRESVTGGGSPTCSSRVSVPAYAQDDQARRLLRIITAGAFPWRSSRGRSGCTATMGSPRSGRSWRT
jgi:Beta-lactamase